MVGSLLHLFIFRWNHHYSQIYRFHTKQRMVRIPATLLPMGFQTLLSHTMFLLCVVDCCSVH